MITANTAYSNMLVAPARTLKGRVELYEGSTLLNTFNYDDSLVSFTIDRAGEEGKFFGFGICQRLTVVLADKERAIDINKNHKLEVAIGVDSDYIYPCPVYFVEEVARNENTNELTITAYDAIYRATYRKLSEVTLPESYTIEAFTHACAALLGMPVKFEVPMYKSENLLPYFSGNTYTSNGITFTLNSDNSITLNGTNNGVNNSVYFFTNLNAGSDPLTLEIDRIYHVPNLGNKDIMFVFYDGTLYRSKSGHTFVATTDDYTYQQVYLQVPKGNTTTFNNVTVYPQLQKEITAFDTLYAGGANFSGNESIREVLNDVAEATQTIYYMNNNWELTFKRLDEDGPAALTVDKTQYFTLDSKTNCNLEKLVSTTDLGDNVYSETGIAGVAQYMRNNAFLTLREDLADLLDTAMSVVGGLTINQFNCDWRGNFLVEIGDKISFVTKDDQIITTYLLNDVLTYNGGLKQHTQWTFSDNRSEDLEAPTTLKEALNNTYARVDKVNQEITLVASSVSENTDSISSIRQTTEDINLSVSEVQKTLSERFESVTGEIDALSKKVDVGLTAEDVRIEVNTVLQNGVNKVSTTTGYVFDDDGLTISKTGSEITTQITEDGMTVSRNDEAVLTANNKGVYAQNLHATTYLIIGEYSRLEDYVNIEGATRTGCFWIG